MAACDRYVFFTVCITLLVASSIYNSYVNYDLEQKMSVLAKQTKMGWLNIGSHITKRETEKNENDNGKRKMTKRDMTNRTTRRRKIRVFQARGSNNTVSTIGQDGILKDVFILENWRTTRNNFKFNTTTSTVTVTRPGIYQIFAQVLISSTDVVPAGLSLHINGETDATAESLGFSNIQSGTDPGSFVIKGYNHCKINVNILLNKKDTVQLRVASNGTTTIVTAPALTLWGLLKI